LESSAESPGPFVHDAAVLRCAVLQVESEAAAAAAAATQAQATLQVQLAEQAAELAAARVEAENKAAQVCTRSLLN
jgi:hypothetical protein